MKVVLINDQLNTGGAERVLVNMANLLYKNKVDVSVLLFLKASALDDQIDRNIKVTYLHRKSRFDFKAMQLLKETVKQADIVHVHSRYNLRYFMVAKYLLGISTKKIAFHEHVPEYSGVDGFTKWLLRKVDAYIGVQDRLCHWVKEQKLLTEDKVFVLPNIVSKPATTVKYTPGKKIVMVANFRRIKNQLFALEVLQALHSDYTLDFYGMTDEEEYFNEVLQAIKNKGLQQRVSIKKGVTNIYEVLPEYSFAIHTAVNETGPLVLLEYMNAGLPFLTYNTGEVVNNIRASMPQLVVQSFKVEEWVNTIYNELTNEEGQQMLQQKMKELIADKYSEEKYCKDLKNIYLKTLAN